MVAIKEIKKDLLMSKSTNERSLKAEIDIMRSINHPNIIKLHSVYENEVYVYLVMEYIDGGSLRELVRATRKLDEARAKKLTWQILNALKYLHSKQIIHRDIKLGNILISGNKDMEIKICDFGLSCTSGATGNER